MARLRSPSVNNGGGAVLTRTGFIDHVGIGVPDLVAAKEYYDDLMSVLGLREWFETGPGGPLNYGPDGAQGSQLFFYQAEEPGTYSRRGTGLHHLHSWSRAERSSGTHTSGRAHARPSSWTNHASSPSTENTALRPTGLTRMGSSWRRFATVPKRARRRSIERRGSARARFRSR
jgi:catechol 2,3-dioxygenase-like lactoylglutathione lyase family enzyme